MAGVSESMRENLVEQRAKARRRISLNSPASGERRPLTIKERAVYLRVIQRADKILDAEKSPAPAKKKRGTAESTRSRRRPFEKLVPGLGKMVSQLTDSVKKQKKD